jgi:tripartite-type tricarboxylate transporter receptor subunit TctC
MPRMAQPACIIVAAFVALAGASFAQEWPARPVTIVIPFAAGGPTDVAGRILAERLTGILGQTMVVENMGGAGGMTGSNRVAQATPDGYTALHGNIATHVYGQILYKRPLYDARTDFVPIGLVVESQRILIARKDLPADTFPQFVAYARANQDKMQYGSAGVGSGTHIGCLLLDATLGTRITHVPYRGTGPAMQDLIAGRIDFLCDVISNALPMIQSGAVKAIANMSAARTASLPDLPTVQEQGFAGFDTSGWDAYFLPKGASQMIVRRLVDAVNTALDAPALRQRYETLGLDVPAPERRGPAFLARLINAGIEQWSAPIRASGVSAD